MRIRRLFHLCFHVALCLAVLAGCETATTQPTQAQLLTPESGDAPPPAAPPPTATVWVPLVMTGGPKEGEMGIVFQNGVECLGEEAEARDGSTVYVSPTGSDSNPGTSADASLASLAYALCNLIPGQTLKVLPGVYSESVILGAFGSQDAAIAIEGLVEEERWPVLDGGSLRTMGMAFVESVNVSVENLELGTVPGDG